MSSIGTIPAGLLTQFLLDVIGRKYTIMIYWIPQIISWIMIIFGHNFATICAARAMGGFGYSGSYGLATVYLAETVDKNIRGKIIVFVIMTYDVGACMVGLMGATLSYDNMNLALSIIPIFHLMTLPFISESPYFLFMRNRDEEGVKSVLRLRGKKNPESISSEIKEIKEFATQLGSQSNFNFKELFTSKPNRKGMLIVACGIMTQILSGNTVMLVYAQEIFGYSGFSLSPAYSASLVSGVKIFSSLFVIKLMDTGSRRIFFLISGISCGISLAIVGLFFFLKFHIKMNVSDFTWLPLAGLIIFEIALPLGVSSIPHILLGEVFSMEAKRAALFCINLFMPVSLFALKLMFPIVNDSVGIYVSFFIFSSSCFIGSITFFCIAPETRGKSLNEIRTILKSK